MGARTSVSPQDYLSMSFDGPDREYVDGEVVERNMGSTQHSKMMKLVLRIFAKWEQAGLYALPEVRHRLAEDLYRIPDVAVYAGGEPVDGEIPSTPPYVVIEIVSPDDRYTALLEKLEEYRAWGVAHIWLIDPQTRKLAELGSDGLRFVHSLRMPEQGAEIAYSEIFPA